MRLTTRPQGVASLCPGLSPYAPLGLLGDGSSYQIQWVLCPNGAQGYSPGQRPGFGASKRIPALKGRNPSAREPTHRCFAVCGLGRIDGWHSRGIDAPGVGIPRASLRYALGYLMMPLWGCGTMNGFMPQRGAR